MVFVVKILLGFIQLLSVLVDCITWSDEVLRLWLPLSLQLHLLLLEQHVCLELLVVQHVVLQVLGLDLLLKLVELSTLVWLRPLALRGLLGLRSAI